MASLFDKKETSALPLLIYTVFLISLMALNNNEKITTIPYVYIAFRVINITFSIYIALNVIMLIKDTFKELQKRTLLETMQIVFIVFLMIVMLFVTIESIIHTASYINKVFKLV
ncbi:hypothetical protein [Senegalia massiliensis]|uniref:Uncharacterized protein n=1 Tax=Senegalia massiliensis TaxID=1720316 RepID=A0A845QWC8_9CLOT|nr:hypothetical protein [Senegalia massiliensis]NBI06581.1 hypothetical protein [Senegalia massiliensis]